MVRWAQDPWDMMLLKMMRQLNFSTAANESYHCAAGSVESDKEMGWHAEKKGTPDR